MADPRQWGVTEETVAGVPVRLRRAGSGAPVLVLHHDFGSLDDLPFYRALASRFDVLVPEHPGFGTSVRPEWMRSVRDLAVLYRELLGVLGIPSTVLVGLGFGGWVAAEMATMAPSEVERLALVGAMGIQPREGFILDQALLGYTDYVRSAFSDPGAFDAIYGEEPSGDQLELWDVCREMCFRIAWKPYMYSQTLPHLLRSMPAKSLVVWGEQDRVVPVIASEQYAEVLPDARRELIAQCGHAVALECPERLAELVIEFAG